MSSQIAWHQDGEKGYLIGLVALARMAFVGSDLTPARQVLLDRIIANPTDAEAMLDLSILLQLMHQDEQALALQGQALALTSHFRLQRPGKTGLKLLLVMAPGRLMDNAPIEFLLEMADASIDLFFLTPDCESLPEFPDHDLLYIAIGQSCCNRELLLRLDIWLRQWPKPVINLPSSIAQTSRKQVYRLLKDSDGLLVPPTADIERAQLMALARGEINPVELLDGAGYPVIVRPLDSHAGQGLRRLESSQSVHEYLTDMPDEEQFQISAYVDYRSKDGQFRKYRIVLIDGVPYAGHMAVSENWMVHYLNANMVDNPANRDEEAAFMRDFDIDFARRHAIALRAVHAQLKLNYLVIDCGETDDGRLLIFEVDAGAIIHDMDPVTIFPYKPASMQKLFSAFERMLSMRAGGGVTATAC